MGLCTFRTPFTTRIGAFVSSQIHYLLPALVVRAANEAKPGLLQDLAGCLGYRLRDILIDHFQVMIITLLFCWLFFSLISFLVFKGLRLICIICFYVCEQNLLLVLCIYLFYFSKNPLVCHFELYQQHCL